MTVSKKNTANRRSSCNTFNELYNVDASLALNSVIAIKLNGIREKKNEYRKYFIIRSL